MQDALLSEILGKRLQIINPKYERNLMIWSEVQEVVHVEVDEDVDPDSCVAESSLDSLSLRCSTTVFLGLKMDILVMFECTKKQGTVSHTKSTCWLEQRFHVVYGMKVDENLGRKWLGHTENQRDRCHSKSRPK